MSTSSSTTSPRRSKSHSTISPTNPPLKRAFSAAVSPRQMFTRGKRARRSSSSSPSHSPSSIIIPVASSLTALSTPALNSDLACSAPPTPFFPSTSTAFFPTSHTSRYDSSTRSSFPSPHNSRSNLDALHRDAFTSLRQSVAESGEGFVRRMREWEQQRRGESRKISMLGNEKDRRDQRSRKPRVSRVDHRSSGGHPSYHTERYRSNLSHRDGNSRVTTGNPRSFEEQDGTDDEDDIMIDGPSQLVCDMDHPHKKRRPASLAMEVCSPELFDVEIADSDGEAYSASRFGSTLGFPSTYLNTRSSSPLSFTNTSDDDESYAHTHSGFSSPRAMHHSVDWSKNSVSLPRVSDTPAYPVPIPSSEPAAQDLNSPQTASEKAMAALALALANGSGSLADYGSVREAQGDLEELEAGALWD